MANEVRLIDANAFFDKLKKLAELMKQGKIGEIDLNLLIASTPIVDAEPVVHGHWVKYNFLGHDQFACSECQTLGSPQWKRCPVCEAKMDGGNEE